jgi:hypothetical protein
LKIPTNEERELDYNYKYIELKHTHQQEKWNKEHNILPHEKKNNKGEKTRTEALLCFFLLVLRLWGALSILFSLEWARISLSPLWLVYFKMWFRERLQQQKNVLFQILALFVGVSIQFQLSKWAKTCACDNISEGKHQQITCPLIYLWEEKIWSGGGGDYKRQMIQLN